MKKGLKKVKKVTKKRNLYFGKQVHDAIIRYQNTHERELQEKIYVEEIRKPFHKLAENLIFIHSFAKDPVEFQNLKLDCVSFLYETLNKFDPSKGTKAFSYFNVCAKHFLIIQANKKNRIKNRSVSLEDFVNLSNKDKSSIENYKVVASPADKLIFKEDMLQMKKVIDIIIGKSKNENEKNCANAIKVLFNKIDDLELLNKRAIFVYLREISGLSPKQLSVSMSNIRRYYRDILKNNEEYRHLFKGRV